MESPATGATKGGRSGGGELDPVTSRPACAARCGRATAGGAPLSARPAAARSGGGSSFTTSWRTPTDSTREDGSRTDTNGTGVSPASAIPLVSRDGTQFMFTSAATNLVAADTNGLSDVFVKTFRPNTPASTPANPVVQAAPVDPATGGSPVTLEFASVLSGGETTLAVTPEPAPLPSGFSVGTQYYDISTTATIQPGSQIAICISYAGANIGDEGSLRFMHFEGGAWVDITTAVDTVQEVVCGLTSSLSPFAIARPTPTSVSAGAPDSTFGGTTNLSATVSPNGVPGSVTFFVDGSATPIPATYNAANGLATVLNYFHGLNASPIAYVVRAVFAATPANFADSETTAAVLHVGAASTTTVVTVSAGQSSPGQSVTFTATVRRGATLVTEGSITFREGASVLAGPLALNQDGQAAFSTGALAPGVHVVSADYSPSANYLASSGSVGHTVSVFKYDFSGFFQPVDNLPTINVVKAGSAVPIKFSLNGDQGLGVIAVGFPQSTGISCDNGETLDDIEETVAAGASSLSFDPSTGVYTYIWKTERGWGSTCRQLTVRLADGSNHVARFTFR